MTAEPANGDRRVWSEHQVRALGVATDLVTAAAVLGIGRTTAHALARADQFPVPVIRVGRRYRVPVAPILRLLTLPTEPPPGQPPTTQPPSTEAAIHQPREGDLTVGQDGEAARPAGAGGRAAVVLTQRT